MGRAALCHSQQEKIVSSRKTLQIPPRPNGGETGVGTGKLERCLFSVGHSNHPPGRLLSLLRQYRIGLLADVRSAPRSRFAPHFNARPLASACAAAGIRYLYLGRELGGRPVDPALYDAGGHVDYSLVAKSPAFLDGIRRLEEAVTRERVALLCSEEDPAGCHRRLLVGRVMEGRGVTLRHIRGDGRVETEEDVAAREVVTGSAGPHGAWRSVKPVRR